MKDANKLWTRYASHFIVEIQVGRVWTHYLKTESHSAALTACGEALAERAVSKVRVLEHDITHVCNEVHIEDRTAVLQIPPCLTLTDRDEACPKCTTLSPVTNDGQDDWVFCGTCNRAFPSQAA